MLKLVINKMNELTHLTNNRHRSNNRFLDNLFSYFNLLIQLCFIGIGIKLCIDYFKNSCSDLLQYVPILIIISFFL